MTATDCPRYNVTANGRRTANAVLSQAIVLAELHSQQHPRTQVEVTDAASGEVVARYYGGHSA